VGLVEAFDLLGVVLFEDGVEAIVAKESEFCF